LAKTQHAQVVIVDVCAIKLNDFRQFVVNGLSGSLNSKYIVNLNDIIAKSSS
jgi:ABC-type proline/glycine betaine transport system ATPase subunit